MAFRWFKNFLDSKQKDIVSVQQGAALDKTNAMAECYVREIAFYSCVNLIADILSECEFRTFSNFNEIKGDEYYRWNYAPNINESKNAFVKDLITKYYENNEVLVVKTLFDDLIVADGYTANEYAGKNTEFSNVYKGSDYSPKYTFLQNEVFFLRGSEKAMRPLVNGLYSAYQKLLDCTMFAYELERGNHALLHVDTAIYGSVEEQQKMANFYNTRFKSFAEAENAVFPLFDGTSLEEYRTKSGSSTTTRDMRAMFDDVFDFTARAFNIPPVLLAGQVAGTDAAMEQFLTFTIDPLANAIQTEINRKLYGKENVLKGNYLQIDTKNIRHLDVANAPASLEKLIESGIYSVNEVRTMLGEQAINEDWANKHFLTKNYTGIEEAQKEGAK